MTDNLKGLFITLGVLLIVLAIAIGMCLQQDKIEKTNQPKVKCLTPKAQAYCIEQGQVFLQMNKLTLKTFSCQSERLLQLAAYGFTTEELNECGVKQ